MIPADFEPVKQAAGSATKLERLKTRRRLEALVQVLQKRAQVEKRDTSLKIKN